MRKKYGRGQFIRRLSPATLAHQYTDIRSTHVCAWARSSLRYIRLNRHQVRRACVCGSRTRSSISWRKIRLFFSPRCAFPLSSPFDPFREDPHQQWGILPHRRSATFNRPYPPLSTAKRATSTREEASFFERTAQNILVRRSSIRDSYRHHRDCRTLASTQIYCRKVYNYLLFGYVRFN